MMGKTFMMIFLVGAAMLVNAAEGGVVFKADLKAVNEQGLPNLWRTHGSGEFKVFKDDDIGDAMRLVSQKKDVSVIYSPNFPVVAGKKYVLTFKFKSANFGAGPYNKISSSGIVRFKNDAGGMIGNRNYHALFGGPNVGQIGFPYGDEKQWTAKSISFVAPDGASNAYFEASLNNSLSDTAKPEISIANFMVREMATDVAEKTLLENKAINFACNKAAKKGVTEVSSEKDKLGNMTYGPYAKMPPGVYDVTVTLKTDANTSPEPIFLINIEDNGSTSATFILAGTDFAKPDTYQDFTFRAVKINDKPLNLPTYKAKDVVIGFEKIKVLAVKQFKPEEFEEFMAPMN